MHEEKEIGEELFFREVLATGEKKKVNKGSALNVPDSSSAAALVPSYMELPGLENSDRKKTQPSNPLPTPIANDDSSYFERSEQRKRVATGVNEVHVNNRGNNLLLKTLFIINVIVLGLLINYLKNAALFGARNKNVSYKDTGVASSIKSPIKELNNTDFLLHKIRLRGESLSLLSAWYTGSSDNWKKIVTANPGLDVRKIKVGQQIRIPQALLTERRPLPDNAVKLGLKGLNRLR